MKEGFEDGGYSLLVLVAISVVLKWDENEVLLIGSNRLFNSKNKFFIRLVPFYGKVFKGSDNYS